MIHIYNSLTQQKEPLVPLQPGKLGMYVCGMTVYDYCHIGHARVMINFDVISRYLRFVGYEVNYIRNITDIDDKIIKRAQEANETIKTLTERYITALEQDATALNILPPTQQPRATEHIPEMIKLIQTLLTKNYAYVADNGDVYYDVSAFGDYGCLAHQDLDKLRAGARVAVADAKADPLDFVLWKLAKPSEPAWDSPWGPGRPGWHIECSAMALKWLGQHFDIHGGGFDLSFPHHQNELAQSEAANGCKFVNHWLHVGFVQVNKEKMSKSLGNFFTIREVLTTYPAEVLRYFLVASHYRSPINYADDNLASAEAALARFYTTLRGLDTKVASVVDSPYEVRFKAAMDDDFNTPEALAVLFDLAREINRLRPDDLPAAQAHAALLVQLAGILGILQQTPETFLQQGIEQTEQQHIEALIAARNAARAAKDWAKADEVRNQLTALGIILEDGPAGTQWRKMS